MDISNIKQQLCQKYEFIRLIGQGGFADVYLARDKLLEREVAIKILHSQYATDSEIIQRFIREAKLYAKLEHKNLIPVYETGIIDDHAFIVMKYIDGETGKSLQQKQGKLTNEIITSITKEMANTLAYIHSKGIIHRDIKPGNILIEKKTNKIYLADFGIARTESSQTLTQSGLIIGTPNYLSPEQIKGKNIDHRSDIYSLGSMLYELASGKTIFSGQTHMEILYQHVNVEPVPIAKLVPNLPREIKYIISKCLEKKPEDRFQNAGEIESVFKNRAATFISRYLKSLETRKGTGRSKTYFRLFLFIILTGVFVFLIWNNIIKNTASKSGKNGKTSSSENIGEKVRVNKSPEANHSGNKKIELNLPLQKEEKNQDTAEPNYNQPEKKPETIIKQPKPSYEKIQKTTRVSNTPSILKFSSFPAADVYWNDIKLGNTTQIFFKKFNPGKYTFKFVIPDYQTLEKVVTVDPNTEISVHQKFPPYGTITITAKPFAQFYINGKDFGNNPVFKKKMPVGVYTIRAVKNGYITEEKKVKINSKRLTNIYFELKKEKNND